MIQGNIPEWKKVKTDALLLENQGRNIELPDSVIVDKKLYQKMNFSFCVFREKKYGIDKIKEKLICRGEKI